MVHPSVLGRGWSSSTLKDTSACSTKNVAARVRAVSSVRAIDAMGRVSRPGGQVASTLTVACECPWDWRSTSKPP
jgi:hypothetical protein